jgi:hypothetical protein
MTNVENPNLTNNSARDQSAVEEWLAIRKEAGLKIDPETAEVWWNWGQIMDPYGIHPNLPHELDQIGRLYFARSPGSDICVSFYDLPDDVCEALWKKLEDFSLIF